MNDKQVIFSTVKVGRVFQPNNKQVLRDISIGFYYGAKIGVLGLNGSGKSTLLNIIAGKDDGYNGEVVFSPGYSVGMLDQEPHLDDTKTVQQVVEEAVQPIVDMLKRFDAVNEKFADPDADFDALLAEQSKLQDELDKREAWTLNNRLDLAMDALRCPPGDTSVKPSLVVSVDVWHLPACCLPNRISFCWTNRPTTWTLNQLPGWSVICSNIKARSLP